MSILSVAATALSPYKLAAEVIVFGALTAGVLYGVHEFLEHERDVGRKEVQALWDKEKNDAAAAALKITTDQNAARDLAVSQGEQRDKTITVSAAAVAAAAASLRSTTASVQSYLSTASVEANRKYSAVASSVLGECISRYRTVAEAAQRGDSTARTLNDAFPVAPAPAK